MRNNGSGKEDRDTVERIFKTMSTSGTEHMVTFLNYILTKLDIMDKLFQSQSPKVHRLYNSIRKYYTDKSVCI